MESFKSAVNYAIIIFMVIYLGRYINAKFSTTEMELTCSGKWVTNNKKYEEKREIVFAIIEEYGPWIFWGKSDGIIRVESKHIAMLRYFESIERIGENPLALYRISRDSETVGGYRTSTKELVITFADDMTFSGTCSEGI